MDNKPVKTPPKRLLIIKLSALGDIVQSLPVVQAVKETWPETTVDWITGDVGYDLLKGHPLLDRVLLYPRKQLGALIKTPLGWPKLFKELYRLRQTLFCAHYDVALELQGLLKSGLVCLLSGAPLRVGFDRGREMSHLFLNRRLPPYDPDRHAVLRYLDLAKAIGAQSSGVAFPLALAPCHIDHAKRLLEGHGITPGSFVILIPGTVWPTKRWTTEAFANLATRTSRELHLPVITIGASCDRPLGKEIEALSRGAALDLTGQTDLKTLAALFKLCNLVVSTDTGPMHLAVAAGARVIALFGPTAPWRTGPFGPGHLVIRRDIPCSPCFKRQCPHNSCMKEISPQEVFEAIKKLANIQV